MRLGALLALAAVACLIAGCSRTGTSSSTNSASVTATTLSGTDNQLTVYLSDPPSVQASPSRQDVADAEQLAWNTLESQLISKRAHLKLVVVKRVVSDNARTAIDNSSLIAYLGEIESGQSVQTVGITNAEDVVELSPTDDVAPSKDDFEDDSTYGRTFASLPIDLGTSSAALQAAVPTFASTFKSAYGHAPASDAIQGYDAVHVLLRVLAYLGNDANDRSKIARDTIATLKANRGRAAVANFTLAR